MRWFPWSAGAIGCLGLAGIGGGFGCGGRWWLLWVRCDRQRLHSTIGYLSSVHFEDKYWSALDQSKTAGVHYPQYWGKVNLDHSQILVIHGL